MTALSIQPTFPIFTDIDGQPLEDGYIFIGVANLAPIGNPISVYWDAALTIAAAQPIRTRGGYPINSGTPARLYVNSDYSILVQNRNGSVVYSAPAATERLSDVIIGGIDSTDVSFLQSGSGAVTRTVQAKLRESVSVKDFGATGDGVTDDTAAIVLALAASKSVYFPAGTYLCSSIVFNVSGKSGRNIQGASTTETIFKATVSATNFFQITGNYNQFNTFENFSIDMSLMTNAGTSRGLYLKQTFGNSFRNVNVINSGNLMRTLYCDVGTYTTVFDNCDFGSTTGIIQLQGISLSDAVTTVTLIGCSFGQCIADQVVAATFLQPVVQGALNKFVLSNVSGLSIVGGDIEGTGTYLVIGSAVGHLCSSNNELSGFSGTYSTGTFVDGYLMDIYGSISFSFKPNNGSVHKGVITEQSSAAALLRKILQNTNAIAQQVDIQFENIVGSLYAGLKADGSTVINGIGSKPIILQQSGVDRFGIDTASRLIIGTLTQITVGTAGTASALPALPSGFARIVIGGTDYVIPYYKQI
jgi:hypothetical protein